MAALVEERDAAKRSVKDAIHAMKAALEDLRQKTKDATLTSFAEDSSRHTGLSEVRTEWVSQGPRYLSRERTTSCLMAFVSCCRVCRDGAMGFVRRKIMTEQPCSTLYVKFFASNRSCVSLRSVVYTQQLNLSFSSCLSRSFCKAFYRPFLKLRKK